MEWPARGVQLYQCKMQSKCDVGQRGNTVLYHDHTVVIVAVIGCKPYQLALLVRSRQTPSTFPSDELWFPESVAPLRLPPNRPKNPPTIENQWSETPTESNVPAHAHH